MIVFSAEQFETLRVEMRRRFLDSLADDLLERFPGRFASRDEALAFADAAVRRAQGYGLGSRPAARRFTRLAAEFGATFDMKPLVAPVLRRLELSAETRLARVEAKLTYGAAP